jgi:hypothetical protein
MTDTSQRNQFATRRCVLLGAGVLGAAGVLTACSTAAVPYDADEQGQAPPAPASPAHSSTARRLAERSAWVRSVIDHPFSSPRGL